MNVDDNHKNRIRRARIALEGLSVGDALGGFFEFTSRSHFVENRQLPTAPWHYTDDTNMALSIYAILNQFGEIKQDELAQNFTQHYDAIRGYGMGARTLFARVGKGEQWRIVSKELFRGEGSFGNGGAMRAAPLGAYFADDHEALIHNATLSSQITHAHPEGIAGTIAVALAAALACDHSNSPEDILQHVVRNLPASEVKTGLEQAITLQDQSDVKRVAKKIGNGSQVSAQDTVPFSIWCATHYLDDYEEAIWQSLTVGGDADTICAIVGGIIACRVGIESIPEEWVNRREILPQWAFE